MHLKFILTLALLQVGVSFAISLNLEGLSVEELQILLQEVLTQLNQHNSEYQAYPVCIMQKPYRR